MTPGRTAQFIAGLFSAGRVSDCRLLDPGAGIGSLSVAFLERWLSGGFDFDSVELTAFEIDKLLRQELQRTLSMYEKKLPVSIKIIEEDYIEEAVNLIQFKNGVKFTHAILNPPYKKINSHSRYRLLLRKAGIETVNLYSAFVALTLELMEPNGELVAIIPRSFCNGPYYRPFREFMLKRAAIRHVHLFHARNKAFRDDDVLQENVIIMLERGGKQSDVTVTTSTDDGFVDLITHTHPFNRIIHSDDPERFIHVPTSPDHTVIELSREIRYSLEDLGIRVSTGPVVDFRLRQHIRDMPEPGTVPLLYACHLKDQVTEWPKADKKKPNAIHRSAETEKWLYPTGFYCAVRRFSSKEEKRRIMAGVVDPEVFLGAVMLGFENHLNIFHEDKHGLPETLARGLTVFLNTTAVDDYFRRFNGHTQVNATDLRLMKYPSRQALIALGKWAMHQDQPTQTMLDERLEEIAA
ncbi:MAG: Eco57I restriction-modification methylase domain-containing protein [Gammaproteobacteria bacterium]